MYPAHPRSMRRPLRADAGAHRRGQFSRALARLANLDGRHSEGVERVRARGKVMRRQSERQSRPSSGAVDGAHSMRTELNEEAPGPALCGGRLQLLDHPHSWGWQVCVGRQEATRSGSGFVKSGDRITRWAMLLPTRLPSRLRAASSHSQPASPVAGPPPDLIAGCTRAWSLLPRADCRCRTRELTDHSFLPSRDVCTGQPSSSGRHPPLCPSCALPSSPPSSIADVPIAATRLTRTPNPARRPAAVAARCAGPLLRRAPMD